MAPWEGEEVFSEEDECLLLIFCPLTTSSVSLHLLFALEHLPPCVSPRAENASAAGCR